MKEKVSFSGHDKFYCRQFWLKKGIEHLVSKYPFNDEAVIQLGVGRNMVTAIRYWVHAFGLAKNDKPTELGLKLLTDTGYDPYIEDIGTIWLLHYHLIMTQKASIYHLIFNSFLRQTIEFTKDSLFQYLADYCERHELYFNPSSLKNDIGVFINNYLLPEKSRGIESDFSGLLYELNLLTKINRSGGWYKIENLDRPSLHPLIILFCIHSQSDNQTTFSFQDLLNKDYSVGRVFCLSANALNDKLEQLTQLYPKDITFTEDAGIKVLQLKKQFDSWEILNRYYEN